MKITKEDDNGTIHHYLNGQLHREDGPAIEYPNGCELWYQYGKYHREDGPAIIWQDGSKEWWQNGLRHRLNGPAIEFKHGLKEWWQNGSRHRLDGPAVEAPDQSKEWWIEGKQLTKEEFDKYFLPKYKTPQIIRRNNGSFYYNENNQLHRLNGPAIEYTNGINHWYIHGQKLTKIEFDKFISILDNEKIKEQISVPIDFYAVINEVKYKLVPIENNEGK